VNVVLVDAATGVTLTSSELVLSAKRLTALTT